MAVTKDAPVIDQMVFLFDNSGALTDITAQIRVRLLENGNPTLIQYVVQTQGLFASLTATQQTNLSNIAARLRQAALANTDPAMPTPATPGPFIAG